MAVPAMLQSLLGTLVFAVDRAMLGAHGDASLAGMQIAGPVEWSLFSIFAAFEIGTLAVLGRKVGAGAHTSATVRASLAIALVMGLMLALAVPLVPAFCNAFAPDASSAARSEAAAYLAITMAASPVVFLTTASATVLAAAGDTRTPLYVSLVTQLVHIACNKLLISGGHLGRLVIPALGAKGAGISTAFTFALSAVALLVLLRRPGRTVILERGEGTFEVVGALVRTGWPALIERAVYHAGFMAFVRIITGLGQSTMAANQVLISIESICFLSADGFGVAAAALVAQNLGRNDSAAAFAAAKSAWAHAVVCLSLFGLVALVFRGPLIALFSDSPAVESAARSAMPVLAIAQPLMATGIVLSKALRGVGRTGVVLGVTLLCAVGLRVSATWFFTQHVSALATHALVAVWLGSTADWVGRTIILLWLGGRERKSLVANP